MPAAVFVEGQSVASAVARETAVGNAVGMAPGEGANVRLIGEVAGKFAITKNHARPLWVRDFEITDDCAAVENRRRQADRRARLSSVTETPLLVENGGSAVVASLGPRGSLAGRASWKASRRVRCVRSRIAQSHPG